MNIKIPRILKNKENRQRFRLDELVLNAVRSARIEAELDLAKEVMGDMLAILLKDMPKGTQVEHPDYEDDGSPKTFLFEKLDYPYVGSTNLQLLMVDPSSKFGGLHSFTLGHLQPATVRALLEALKKVKA